MNSRVPPVVVCRARRLAFAAAVAVGLLAFLASREASAAPSPGSRSVWISAEPWTCVHQVGALAREAELACDAAGGRCRVAEAESGATVRAVLECGAPERWTLRIEAVDGRGIVDVTLDGDRDERLRKAAMWIARVDERGDAARAPEAAATERAPAAAAPPSTALSFEPAELPTAHEASEPKPRPRGERGGVQLDAAIGVTNSSRADSFHGVHAAVLYPVGRFALGPAASYEQAFTSRSDFADASMTTTLGRAAGRFGWGAPFDDSTFGVWAEVGLAWGRAVGQAWSSLPFADASRATHFVAPYGRAEVVMQLPFRSPIRPFVYAAGMHTFNQFDESVQTALIGAGLAWRAW